MGILDEKTQITKFHNMTKKARFSSSFYSTTLSNKTFKWYQKYLRCTKRQFYELTVNKCFSFLTYHELFKITVKNKLNKN